MRFIKGKRQFCLMLALSFVFSLLIAGYVPAMEAQASDYDYEVIMSTIKAKLKKDKVNVVAWDADLENAIYTANQVYPGLESGINYINIGVGRFYMIEPYKSILSGAFSGYTIVFPLDICDLGSVINKADPITKVGYNVSDYSNSYKYARTMGTYNGELRALCYSLCPGCLYFNTSIAKKVLGTDDPVKIQEMIATPAKFNDVAKKMKDKGYYMTSGLNEVSVNSGLSDGVYAKYMFSQLQDLLKTYDSDKYDNGGYVWNDKWVRSFTDGNVFCFYGATWMKYSMSGYGVKDGTYGICEGPVSYAWGSTFLFAKDLGTQGASASNLLTLLTSDEKVLTELAKRNTFVNNKKLNKKLASDPDFGDVFYAGKANPVGIWHSTALKLGGESESGGGSSAGNSGWVKDNGKWKYYRADGTQVKSAWQKISGKWYYFDSKGYMVNGWQKINKKWYYFKNGVMQNGWKKISGKWYYFKNGVMKNGWLRISGKWYYFNSDGSMVTGSKKIGGKTYKFDSSGVCQNP